MKLKAVRAGLPLVLIGVMAVIAAVDVLQDGATHGYVPILLAFLVAIALGSLLQFRLASGQEISPVSMSLGYGLALASATSNDRMLGYDAAWVIVIVTSAMAGGTYLAQARGGHHLGKNVLAARVAAIAVTALLYRHLPVFPGGRSALERYPDWSGSPGYAMLAMLSAAIIGAAAEPLLTIVLSDRPRTTLRGFLDNAFPLAAVSVATVSTGVAIALSLRALDYAAIPLMVLPTLLMRFALRRQANVRATRRQTIASLSRLTEVAGYTTEGHSARVADLSRRVADELRLSDRDTAILEDAALLHDIGQVSLSEPIPGGATVEAAPIDQEHIAAEGASIVRRSEVLDEVADVLEHQATPFRQVREFGEDVPLASRIVKVCNAYDDLTGGRRDAHEAAVERLSLGLGYEYDPVIIDALVTVKEREPHATA